MKYGIAGRAGALCGALLVIVAGCSGGGAVSDEPAQPDARATAPEQPAPEPETAAESARVDLIGVWLLEDLGGRGVMDIVQTTIEFDADGGVRGSGGCNRFTGSYTFTDGVLELGPLASTKRLCPEAVMNQEDGFHRALGSIGRVEMDGPSLLIHVEGFDMPIRFTRLVTADD
jgi:heat shock protein HslJ